MPVPSLSAFVLIAAAVSVRNGSMASACTLRSSSPLESPATGRCECSDAHNDSKPRSSSATASSDGEIEYSVNHIVAPKCMTGIPYSGVSAPTVPSRFTQHQQRRAAAAKGGRGYAGSGATGGTFPTGHPAGLVAAKFDLQH